MKETLLDIEGKLREKFHSFWNNKLYGDGDTEPLFPSYSEIQDFWLSEMAQSLQSQANQYERQKGEMESAYCAGITKIASELRDAGFKKTADLIDRDLEILKTNPKKYGVDLSE